MRGDVAEPQRARLLDEQPEQAAPLGPVVDLGDLTLGQADRDEFHEALVIADHAERPVASIDEVHRGLHDAAEHRFKFQAGADRDDGLEKPVHPVPGTKHSLKACLQLR